MSSIVLVPQLCLDCILGVLLLCLDYLNGAPAIPFVCVRCTVIVP